MESLLETIDLDIDESTELAFKVQIEGAGVPAKVRLVCEGPDMAYMFNAHSTSEDSVVQFVLPPMKDKLKEGEYKSRVEVLIDNRYFAPVLFNLNFKKTLRVVAEHVVHVTKPTNPEIKVSVAPVITPTKTSTIDVQPSVKQEQKPVSLRERLEIKKHVKEPVKKPAELTVTDEAKIRELARQFIRGIK